MRDEEAISAFENECRFSISNYWSTVTDQVLQAYPGWLIYKSPAHPLHHPMQYLLKRLEKMLGAEQLQHIARLLYFVDDHISFHSWKVVKRPTEQNTVDLDQLLVQPSIPLVQILSACVSVFCTADLGPHIAERLTQLRTRGQLHVWYSVQRDEAEYVMLSRTLSAKSYATINFQHFMHNKNLTLIVLQVEQWENNLEEAQKKVLLQQAARKPENPLLAPGLTYAHFKELLLQRPYVINWCPEELYPFRQRLLAELVHDFLPPDNSPAIHLLSSGVWWLVGADALLAACRCLRVYQQEVTRASEEYKQSLWQVIRVGGEHSSIPADEEERVRLMRDLGRYPNETLKELAILVPNVRTLLLEVLEVKRQTLIGQSGFEIAIPSLQNGMLAEKERFARKWIAESSLPNELKNYLNATLHYPIALDLQDAEESSFAIGSSKVGGLPDLPTEIAWPENFEFIAQFNLAELAPYDLEQILPVGGMLYFFCSPTIEFAGEDGVRVIYYDGDPARLKRAEVLDEALRLYTPSTVAFHTEVSLVDGETTDLLKVLGSQYEISERIAVANNWMALCESVRELAGVPHFPLLLGQTFCRSLHSSPLELKKWRWLFYLGSGQGGMGWCDADPIYFSIDPDDLAKRDFSRCEGGVLGS